LVRAPEFAFRAAAGSWVEIQTSFEILTLDETTADGESRNETGSGDARIFTKVRVLRENRTRPGLAVRFGTKLPNASAKKRLGTDETDFHFQGLISKDFGPLSVHGNFGLSILGNPGPFLGAPDRSSTGQDDVFSTSLAVVSKPFVPQIVSAYRFRFFGEVDGLSNSRFDNDRAAASFGLQVQRGPLTAYSGISAGLITASQNFGLAAGLIYTFALDRLLGATD